MGKAYETIAVIPGLCDGCGDCVTACLQVKGIKDPVQSRIKPIKDLKEPFFAPTICLQCGDPACVSSCPAKALTKNPETGVIEWNKECCVNCLLCTLACPYGGVFFDPVEGHVAKCDQCGGDPACVKVCKPKALVCRQESQVFNRVGDLEDLFVANSGANAGSSRNTLYHNIGGTNFQNNAATNFVRVATSPFTTDWMRVWCAAWADYDNDGNVDLIAANLDGGVLAQRLYRNNGNGSFTAVVDSALRSDTK